MGRRLTKTIPAMGQYGLILDKLPQELPLNAFSRAINVRFRYGQIERFEGDRALFQEDIPVTPYYIASFRTAASKFFVFSGTASTYAHDGTTLTDITGTPYTGAQDDRFSGAVFHGFYVQNGPLDVPKTWDGNTANNLTSLVNWNANHRCKVLRAHKDVLIAMNITESGIAYPTRVRVSSIADAAALPPSWDETNPAEEAMVNDISAGTDASPIVEGASMGGDFLIYRENSITRMSLGGPQGFYWSFNPLNLPFGALGTGCVAEIPLGHVVLTTGDVVLHDGVSYKSIAYGRVQKSLFQSMNSTYRKRSFVVANPSRSEVWVCFPSNGASVPDTAYVWNYVDDNWTTRTLANISYACTGQINGQAAQSWAQQTQEWEDSFFAWNSDPFSESSIRLVTCSTSPEILLCDSAATMNGATFSSVAERDGLGLDDHLRTKTVTNFYPRVSAGTGSQVLVQLGGTMDMEQGATYPYSKNYTVGSTYQSDGFAVGRFMSYRVSSVGDAPYRMESGDLEYQMNGRY